MNRVQEALLKNRRITDTQMALYNSLSPRDTYRVLEFYYLSNGLYALLQANNGDATIWTEGMLGLRNPAHRVVEFYVGKLWPGDLPAALPIVTNNERIVAPIQQVWTWSNWASRKQVFTRWYANFGDGFIKVVASQAKDRVYFQTIKPEFITEIDADERDYLTYCRIDIPQTRRNADGKIESYWHTEVWNKADLSFRTWENKKGPDEALDKLGTPKTNVNYQEAYQIDFIPIVHAKFQDIGQKRGIGAFTHALDKIDEANRMATRLHQILYRYNKPLWAASANDKDNQGRPLPAPKIGDGNDIALDGDGDKENIVRLPGMSTLTAMIPQIQYDQALAILNAHMVELMHDLPELAYYAIRERTGDITGRAARILLGDLIDKARDARGNAEAALARANAMALTIGQNLSLFSDVGSYENGDFDHTFAERDIIPLSELEKAETTRAYSQGGVPTATAARWAGKSDEDIEAMETDRQRESQQRANSLAQALIDQQRQFDRGQQQPGETPG
jgi:hypothetical protein